MWHCAHGFERVILNISSEEGPSTKRMAPALKWFLLAL